MSESVSDPRAVSRDIFSATLGSVFCCYTYVLFLLPQKRSTCRKAALLTSLVCTQWTTV